MATINNKPYFEATFDASGTLVGDSGALITDISQSGVKNLFVFSHGWNNQVLDADGLYRNFFPLLADSADQHPELTAVGFVGVHWPSIWWPDRAGQNGAVAGDAQADSGPAAAAVNVQQEQTGAEIAGYLQSAFPGHEADLATMGQLIDQGLAQVAAAAPDTQQQAALDQFHALLGQVVATSVGAVEDQGESAVWAADDPATAYLQLHGAMTTAASGGDEQGLADKFGAVWNGAKDALRVASFWQMKARAGTVGEHGLGSLLAGLHTALPDLRIHLLGHSFGARLVANTLSAFPDADTPVASLSLIQGAFSHWAFAATTPFGDAGSLLGRASRVRGPLVSTFTTADWAVGVWYPKASFLAGQDTEAAESQGRWDGMGHDGFQDQTAGSVTSLTLGPAGTAYPFAVGRLYGVDANAVIKNTSQSAFSGAHSDIVHPEIAALVAAAAMPIG